MQSFNAYKMVICCVRTAPFNWPAEGNRDDVKHLTFQAGRQMTQCAQQCLDTLCKTCYGTDDSSAKCCSHFAQSCFVLLARPGRAKLHCCALREINCLRLRLEWSVSQTFVNAHIYKPKNTTYLSCMYNYESSFVFTGAQNKSLLFTKASSPHHPFRRPQKFCLLSSCVWTEVRRNLLRPP